jgi:hypothetical protein
MLNSGPPISALVAGEHLACSIQEMVEGGWVTLEAGRGRLRQPAPDGGAVGLANHPVCTAVPGRAWRGQSAGHRGAARCSQISLRRMNQGVKGAL